MIIEVLAKFNRDISAKERKAIDDEVETEALINSDYDIEKEREKLIKERNYFDYGPLVCNLKDVSFFNHVDKNHTCIRFYTREAFTIKMPYIKFKVLYQSTLGVYINDFTESDNIKVDNV